MTNKQFNPVEYRIFEGIVGSQLYGTNTLDSDLDTRGVCIPPLSVLIDPFQSFKVKDSFEGEDRAIYDMGQFFKLCADNNPNILEMLFVPETHVLYSSWHWDYIVENRHLFLSKNIKHRFLGYAFSQLEAIKRHREWYTDAPEHEPTRDEFGLDVMPSISMAWLNSLKQTMNFDIIKDEVVEEIHKEYAFRQAHKKWEQYHQWQTNRNPKRKGTEEQFGYDTKYASHLFRLMEEGRELLLDGAITFPLQNAQWLLDIKNGLLSYEEVLELASTMESKFQSLYDKSPLPQTPDRNKLKDLYLELTLSTSEED